MPPIRFAILAAVSTETQATEEKASIPAQIKTCQQVVFAHGIETAQYILDGYSRSGYDSLQDAMDDIPPLKQAIEDAAANEYDILIVDNYDRFGDLAYMIGTRYKKLKKQIYSARQSGRVVPPAEYDPYADDSMSIHMHVGGIIQNYRINKIRRGYNIGIPARVDRGLHPFNAPYGYKKHLRDQPAQPIPEQIAHVMQMKTWLMEGKSLAEIAQRSNELSITTQRGKQWDITAVHRVLEHEYYAGLVVYGKTVGHKRQPRSHWTFKKGVHSPLWDEQTYHAILAELDRRQQGKTHKQVHTLSGICVCHECGKTMYRGGGVKGKRTYLSCYTHHQNHPMIEYTKALSLVACELSTAIYQEAASPSLKPNSWNVELKNLNIQRTLIQQGYEARLYTAAEAHKKIIVIEKQIDEIDRKIHDVEKNMTNRQILLDIAQQTPEKIEQWVLTGHSREVNRALHAILEGVLITRDQTIKKIIFR